MAVELCLKNSSSWPGADLTQSNTTDSDNHDTSDGSDFDFCVSGEISGQEHSTADELFSEGKLLPLPIVQHQTSPSALPRTWALPLRLSARVENEKKESTLKEIMAVQDVEDEEIGHKQSGLISPSPKPSFWRFGRSTSLKVGGNKSGAGGSGGGGIFSSLQILSRSKSTGSNILNPKYQRQTSTGSCNIKPFKRPDLNHGGTKSTSSSSTTTSTAPSPSSSASSYYYSYGSCRHKQNAGNSGVRISPILNFTPTYVLPKGTGNGFFGFGHLLCSGNRKDRSSRRSSKSH